MILSKWVIGAVMGILTLMVPIREVDAGIDIYTVNGRTITCITQEFVTTCNG